MEINGILCNSRLDITTVQITIERTIISMLDFLLKQNVFVYVMLVVAACGILVRVITYIYMNRLIHEAKKMSFTNNKLLKRIRGRYEDAVKLNMEVLDTEAMIESYVEGYRFLGCPISLLNLSIKQAIIINIGIILTACLYGYNRYEIYTIGYISIAGLIICACIMLLENIFLVNYKMELLKSNIKDYLDNHLYSKICMKSKRALMGKELKNSMSVGEDDTESDSVVEREIDNTPTMEEDMAYLLKCINEIATSRSVDDNSYVDSAEVTETNARLHKGASPNLEGRSTRMESDSELIESILREFL